MASTTLWSILFPDHPLNEETHSMSAKQGFEPYIAIVYQDVHEQNDLTAPRVIVDTGVVFSTSTANAERQALVNACRTDTELNLIEPDIKISVLEFATRQANL